MTSNNKHCCSINTFILSFSPAINQSITDNVWAWLMLTVTYSLGNYEVKLRSKLALRSLKI
jgi:hypothetical protein